MRIRLFASAAMLWLAGTAVGSVSLEVRGRLAPGADAERLVAVVQSTCREFRWHFERRHDAPVIAAIQPDRAFRWFTLTLDGGVLRASFNTTFAGALAHARLVRLIDRLDCALVDVDVRDETGYHARRDATALREFFRQHHARLDALVQIALERGREVVVGGRLFTDVLHPAREIYTVAESEIRQGRLEAAEQALTAAIGLTPRFARAFARRAEVRAELSRLPDALLDAHRAIRLKPKMPRGYYARAKVHLTKGANRLALRDLDRALTLDPDHGEARLLRGLLHGERRALGDAIADLEKVSAPLLDAGRRSRLGPAEREQAMTATEALAACYEAVDRNEDAARLIALLEGCRTASGRHVVLDRDSRLSLDRPNGWRLEDDATDPRIRLRMREGGTSNACRIAVMKKWGEIDDPAFRKTFDESVLQGLQQLGKAPRLVRRVSKRAGSLDVYQILVRNDGATCCWIACLNHRGKMLTVYLTSRQRPDLAEASLQRVLDAIRADGDTP